MTSRIRLGGTFVGSFMVVSGSTGLRSTVYDLGDRLEIEERDHWMITRRRIPLRDVVLMTQHRFRRISLAVATLIPAALVLTITLFVSRGENTMIVLMVFAIMASPFLCLALYLLLVPILEIQIQSRRVTAHMRFGLRAKHGKSIYADLENRIRSSQLQRSPHS